MKLGFQFVPFPREVWTENIELTQAEFRLLGWFCCNLKLGIPQPDVSDDQILSGFRDDSCTYPAVGLSRNSLHRARAGLMEKQMLIAKRKASGGGRGNEAVWAYSINLSNSDKFGAQTLPTLTLNPPNFDDAIRNIESTEKPLYSPFSNPSAKHTAKPLTPDGPDPNLKCEHCGKVGAFPFGQETLCSRCIGRVPRRNHAKSA